MPIRDTAESARQLEAMLVRQLISASGAFKGNEIAGSQLQTDMFVEALADAVVKGGGFGIADMVARQLGGSDADVDAGAEKAPSPLEMPAAAPTPGGITSGFGPRQDPLGDGHKFHTGVDLRGSFGTPIQAAAAGIVKSAGPRGGYGNALEIDHGNGVSTLYGHASEISVKPGEQIDKGQEIARVGDSGRATGPHLHFEVRVGGRPVDPTKALNAYGIRADKTIGAKPGGFDVDR